MSLRKHATSAAKGLGLSAATSVFNTAVKPFTDRLPSLVLQEAELEGQLLGVVLRYLWANGRSLSLGNKMYGSSDHFVAPANKKMTVEYERLGKAQTFIYKGAILFVGMKEGTHRDSPVVSFFRGTVDLEALICDAVTAYNEYKGGVDSARRFGIHRHHGMAAARSKSNRENEKTSNRYLFHDPDSEEDLYQHRPLKWKLEDLVPPVPEAPFAHLVYSPEVTAFYESIDLWLKSKEWYKTRTIPWRMSGLLKGPPGSGKTSFVRATAQQLDLPIHVLDLASMSNSDLIENWDEAASKAPCVILLEDLDRIFDETKNITHSSKFSFESGITLDCLLNCISGVDTHDGVLLIATANYVDRLDAALLRPGRLDQHVYFGELDDKGRTLIAARILAGFESEIPAIVDAGKGETGAAFERRCQDHALRLFWAKERGVVLADRAPVVEMKPEKVKPRRLKKKVTKAKVAKTPSRKR